VAGASYRAITVNVAVGASASSPQVNRVSVSGGGAGAASTVDSTVIKSRPAALSISKSHTGNFTRGQTEATYMITVTNASAADPTSGTVTVTEMPPTNLTVLSMTGTGWTCPSPGTTCTRADPLNPGANFPSITVKVNVAENAGSPLTNSVTVSGGGAPSATAVDSTLVLPSGPALSFVPITPCRVVDTRGTAGPFGGPAMGAGTSRSFVLTAGSCGVPPNAVAFSLNVTVVPHGPLGYLTIWPSDQPRPVASTLNSFDGRVKANAAIVPANASGAVSVYATDTTDAVLDLNGYFVPSTGLGALAFYPVSPCRVFDTRSPNGPQGGPSMSALQTRDVPITSGPCGIPANAKAFSMNFTVIPKAGLFSFLATWPAGLPRPGVSTLNAFTGAVTANAAIVPAGVGGAISIYTTDAAEVFGDINGYFADPTSDGLYFYAKVPCRVVDTRNSVGPFGGPSLNGSRDFQISAGSCSLPAASAYSLNVTVVPQGRLDFLTLWPATGVRPGVSTLNAFDGSVTSNAAIVPAAAAGTIRAFSTQVTDFFLDINGYFAH
jgi:uncharacterized repeat protein (TIGR01451 family)